MATDTMTWNQVQTEGLKDWRMLYSTLHARFLTGTFATGLQLVQAIGEAAESANHHPDVVLQYSTVTVRMSSHDVGGITRRDIDLARQISRLAGDQEVAADPGSLQVLELALDTADRSEIRPFWAAVLGASMDGQDDEVADPTGSVPTIWFQETDAHEEPRQRFHLDIRVPREVAEDRVAAALAAGGVLVGDEAAPAFWVLADAQGNKVCVCTGEGRD